MTQSGLRMLFCASMLFGCAHPQTNKPDDTNTPVTGPMSKGDPVFYEDQANGKACQGDSDCNTGELCYPENDRCMSSYPNPRMLDFSLQGKATNCKLVNLYFPYDSTELVADAQRWLQYNVRCIKARESKEVVLKGHADSRGPTDYNQKLSVERGEAVRTLLGQAGLVVPVTVHGRGETQPLRAGKTEKDYAYNRRVEFTAH